MKNLTTNSTGLRAAALSFSPDAKNPWYLTWQRDEWKDVGANYETFKQQCYAANAGNKANCDKIRAKTDACLREGKARC